MVISLNLTRLLQDNLWLEDILFKIHFLNVLIISIPGISMVN